MNWSTMSSVAESSWSCPSLIFEISVLDLKLLSVNAIKEFYPLEVKKLQFLPGDSRD